MFVYVCEICFAFGKTTLLHKLAVFETTSVLVPAVTLFHLYRLQTKVRLFVHISLSTYLVDAVV